MDWILRDIERVRQQCIRAQRGEFSFHMQTGHPLGFLDVAHAGEAATAVSLVDPDGIIAELRELVTPYPDALRSAWIDHLWHVDFLLDAAAKGAARGDAVYVALCASHAVLLIAHAWHAAARTWVTNEKGLVVDVARLPVESDGFAERAAQVLAHPGDCPADLAKTVTTTRALPRPSI